MAKKRIMAFLLGSATATLAGAALAQTASPPTTPVAFAPPEKKPDATPPAASSNPPASSATAPILESETSDTSTLAPPTAHRLYVGSRMGGYAIVNGDTAKIVGTVNGSNFAVLAVPPGAPNFYVAETLWSKGNRGDRQDMISVYDGKTLALTSEIKLPGRLIAGGRSPFFTLNASGTTGYVYNMEPAPSVITVDLQKKAVKSTVEIPGCGLVYPYGEASFASLCADGSLATASLDAKGKATIGHTPVFFDVEKDPIFEESLVDAKTGDAFFISYTGVVHPMKLSGTTAQALPTWTLPGAAGLAPATTEPQHQTWRAGGRHPFAYHAPSGRLFALMHDGHHWSQKEAGTEVWVIDTKSQKVLSRFALPTNGYTVAVSGDADPQLYVISESGWLWVMDPTTGKILRSLNDIGRPSLTLVQGF